MDATASNHARSAGWFFCGTCSETMRNGGVEAGLFEQLLSLPFESQAEHGENSDPTGDESSIANNLSPSAPSDSSKPESVDDAPESSDEQASDSAIAVAAIDQQAQLQVVEDRNAKSDSTAVELAAENGDRPTPLEATDPENGTSDAVAVELEQPQEATETETISPVAAAVTETNSAELTTDSTQAEHLTPELKAAFEASQRSKRDQQQTQEADDPQAELSLDSAAPDATKTATTGTETEPRAALADLSLNRSSDEVSDRGDIRSQRARRGRWFEKDENSANEAARHQSSAEAKQKNKHETVAQNPIPNVMDASTHEANMPAATAPTTNDVSTANDTLSPSVVSTLPPPAADATVGRTRADTASGGASVTNSSAGGEETNSNVNTSEAARRNREPSSVDGKGGQMEKPEVNQQERVRLVQRIARSFARLGPEGGNINLRLHPPQLGSLNVQVRLEGRTMTAKLTAENSAAREVILEGLPTLRSRLAEQGFEISQFQVDVASNGSDAALGNGSQQETFRQDTRERNAELTRALRSDRGRFHQVPDAEPRRGPVPLSWQLQSGIDVQA